MVTIYGDCYLGLTGNLRDVMVTYVVAFWRPKHHIRFEAFVWNCGNYSDDDIMTNEVTGWLIS